MQVGKLKRFLLFTGYFNGEDFFGKFYNSYESLDLARDKGKNALLKNVNRYEIYDSFKGIEETKTL